MMRKKLASHNLISNKWDLLSNPCRKFSNLTKNTKTPSLRAFGPRECALEGKALLNSPQFNKGTAFSYDERHKFKLNGLIPPAVQTIEQQVQRAYGQFLSCPDKLQRNLFLQSLREQNEVLYFRLISDNIKEMLPIIYTPTQGEYIANYSTVFRRPEGCFLSIDFSTQDNIDDKLATWGGENDIDYIIVTDSEGILGIGDQGVGGIGISTAKAGLMTLCAGVHPHRVLPIVLDVGTDNEELLNKELYLGIRRRRAKGSEYDFFIDNCVEAIMSRFPNAVLHFEDFGLRNARNILDRYKDIHCVFNDDIQGTGAVALAGITSASLVANKARKDLTIVVYGAGTAGMGIANQLKDALVLDGLTEQEAINQIYLVDKLGLLLDVHGEYLTPAQKVFAKKQEDWKTVQGGPAPITLEKTIHAVKPDVLLGCSGQPGGFSELAIRTMAENTKRPIIFPLSNPTRLVEAYPSDIIAWSDGQALVSTGSPFPPVEYKGRKFTIAECNNALVYPGIGLGCVLSRANLLTEGMIKAAADALAAESPALNNPQASLLPDVSGVREVSLKVAMAVIKKAIEEGVALERRNTQKGEIIVPYQNDKDLEKWVRGQQWQPRYRELKKVALEVADASAKGELGIGKIR